MTPARLLARLRGFRADQRGNVAIIAGITFLALIVIGGTAIDLNRAYTARTQGQDAIDLAGVAAASTRHVDPAVLEQVARDYLAANAEIDVLEDDPEISVTIETASRLDMSLKGSVRTFFMGLIGIDSLPVDVSTAVERGAVDRVELALVLDNTWSMSDVDGTGARKIDALKSAARDLVDALMTREDGTVKIGVVPYADYVNVGMSNRNASWISVPADYKTIHNHKQEYRAAECKTHTTRQTCKKSSTPKTCTNNTDGVITTYDCTPNECTTTTVAPYEVCTAERPERTWQTESWTRWYGCVGSRKEGKARLDDVPGKLYPGIMAGGQNCLSEITPLTDRKLTVTSAINAMVVNIGNYKPLTYIPTGVIWGVNMLSPTAPLTEAADYQPEHRNPRKIMVLMTDGANTLRFSNGDGKHVSANANQILTTDSDTAAICTYAKSKGIEIYTVALAVNSAPAKTLLEGCASGADHYYDAGNAQALARAFADIAASIYRVRIVE